MKIIKNVNLQKRDRDLPRPSEHTPAHQNASETVGSYSKLSTGEQCFFFRKVLLPGGVLDLQSVTFWSGFGSRPPVIHPTFSENPIFGRISMNDSFYPWDFSSETLSEKS